jgi:RHS repeat-associated protein
VQSGGLEKYGFTGQENDANTGLMYYGARYYSPEYRIFIQPDTMLPDPYNPQALNRYAYALNNPVKYTDSRGHYIESAIDIAFLAMDINDIRTGNANKWTYIGLGADVVCLALPGVTGGRLAVKALEEGVTHADNIGDLFKFLDKTTNTGKGAGNTLDASRSADNVVDAGKNILRTDLPSTKITTQKLQHEWKHASDFGIDGKWNRANGDLYEKAIQNHINTASKILIPSEKQEFIPGLFIKMRFK